MEQGPGGVIEAFQRIMGTTVTIVVPAFSYACFESKEYDSTTSPCRVGVLGAHVSALGIRSQDPNLSYAALGPRAAHFTAWHSGRPSVGPGSIFDDLIAADAMVVLLGTGFSSLPVFMHIEAEQGVGYRYLKDFTCKTTVPNPGTSVLARHWVRDESLGPISDRGRIGELLMNDSRCRATSLPYGRCLAIPIRAVAEVTRQAIASDPLILLDRQRPFVERSEFERTLNVR